MDTTLFNPTISCLFVTWLYIVFANTESEPTGIFTIEYLYYLAVSPTHPQTTAPVLVWNNQQIRFLPEDADFDLIMVNSGMAGVSEMTSALLRLNRPFWVVSDQPHRRSVW